CQLNQFYIYNLNHYNKIVNQRNKLLKDINFNRDYKDMLNIWDMQIISHGRKVIERRKTFIDQLNEIIYHIHKNLSGQNEELIIKYVPYVESENFEEVMKKNMEKDIRTKMTNAGPHRDDFVFCSNGMDLRTYGSQGQQRTAALSLKLSEIELVKKVIKDKPVLLLDDVLSELDSNRQNNLLDNIGDIQTIITCTGLDEFVNDRFELNKVYKVTNGEVTQMS
ncbi:MAG: DNA replication and repair protein RecF, partial [Lachnospiraceae bacterium]|nr:DNA replication and repair protein RecF [Lachnospiraceae bacterium]